jgi:hypothetical protein
MNNLILEPTQYTPRINFNIDTGKFEVSGISLPENVLDFYTPVVNWLDTFEKTISADPVDSSRKFVFIFRLCYYNSGSVRFLISMLQIIKRLSERFIVKVEWYYERDDIHLFDNGKELEELTGLIFNFIEAE